MMSTFRLTSNRNSFFLQASAWVTLLSLWFTIAQPSSGFAFDFALRSKRVPVKSEARDSYLNILRNLNFDAESIAAATRALEVPVKNREARDAEALINWLGHLSKARDTLGSEANDTAVFDSAMNCLKYELIGQTDQLEVQNWEWKKRLVPLLVAAWIVLPAILAVSLYEVVHNQSVNSSSV